MKKLILLAAIMLAGTGVFAQKYQGEVLVGYALGVGDNGTDRLNIETVHGVRIGTHFFGGVGVGYHLYNEDGFDYGFIPVFANLKGYLSDNKITPYLSLDLGYGIGTQDADGLDGFYISPALGVRFQLKGKSAITASLGYQSQTVSEGMGGYSVSASSGAIALKVGITF